MYVCLCNGITEKHVIDAVTQGATRMRDLRAELGITRQCGRCSECASNCLKRTLRENGGSPCPMAEAS